MRRLAQATAIAVALPLSAVGQDAVGTMTVTVDGTEREFVLIQGAEGPNPGSRYSQVGQDVVLTLVAVSVQTPVAPEEAAETVELRFTASEEGPEVRTGSVLSYSQKDGDGVSTTRGSTVEVALDSLETTEDGVAASGTFSAELPPDQQSAGTEVEGTFQTTMKPRQTP